VTLWRISRFDSLSGEGGLRSQGRWHTAGRPVVYCAQSPAAALLEMLVRMELALREDPIRYRLLRVDAPDDVSVSVVRASQLAPGWTADQRATQDIGNAWLARKASALLVVPSAVAPETSNVVVNPAHPDAAGIRLAAVSEHELDSRLIK
jgi:RES domain-containing protein